jgi:CrcB protein
VTAGGALGALARAGVDRVLTTRGFPWATLLVNVSGAFGMGAAGTLLTERLTVRRHWRAFVGIGFLGAYTTFSTMALEGVTLLSDGRPATALAYWLATLLLGQMAGVYGMWLARLEPRRREGIRDDAQG